MARMTKEKTPRQSNNIFMCPPNTRAIIEPDGVTVCSPIAFPSSANRPPITDKGDNLVASLPNRQRIIDNPMTLVSGV